MNPRLQALLIIIGLGLALGSICSLLGLGLDLLCGVLDRGMRHYLLRALEISAILILTLFLTILILRLCEP